MIPGCAFAANQPAIVAGTLSSLTDVPFRATVRPMSPQARLALSEHVITGWEAVGGPAGRLADTNRMIREEMLALVALGEDAPEFKERADALIARYQQLALRMKLQ
jgi:hypothetical protein